MKNRILFVCQYFYPEKISSGILPYELACELVKEGFEVNVLTGYPKEYSDEDNIPLDEVFKGMKIKRVRYVQSERSNFLGRIVNYISFCLAVWKQKRVFKDIDKCICYTNPPLLPYIVARLSIKYRFDMFFEIYDLYPDVVIKSNVMDENSIICKIMNYCTNYALKKAMKVIVLSKEMKEYLVNSRQDMQLTEKTIVIPNWYKKQDIENVVNGNKLTILYGGNMGVLQDMQTLLETIIALKNNQSIQFVLAGHGTKKQLFIDAKKQHGLENCTILDFLPKTEYDQLMRSVNIAIVSLENFGKGLGSPSKVYSYLSLGLPIIAIMPDGTDIIEDIANYRNGIHIESGKSNRLVEFLVDCSNNKNILQEMKQHSLKLFNEKYELNKVKRKYVEMLREGENEPI